MRTAALALLLTCASIAQDSAGLRAGVASVEITPSTLMPMYGYSNRKCGPAAGTHDPLFAKALVLEAGGSRLAIVTVDLGSLVSENLRREVASRLNIPTLLLAASHTHSAPAFLPFGSTPTVGPEASAYAAEIERKIFGALEQASKTMFPAKLASARGSLQLGYNRLLLRDNGRARALFDNLERVPHGPVDPEIVLLRVEDEKGSPRALLVHYAVHAVTLGTTSCKYSADYPGVMQSKVEQAMPGTQVMFVQGGAGDINPLFQGRSGREEDDFKVMQTMGELLAAEVLRAGKSTKPLPSPEGIQVRSEVVPFRHRWDKEKTIDVGITTALIGRDIAIATVPGEPMHKLQTMWKQQAEVPLPLFYGYTYSSGGTWAGYVPDLRTAAYGGYGADATTTIEVGAAEKIMLRHLTNLYDMLGMWRDKPGLP